MKAMETHNFTLTAMFNHLALITALAILSLALPARAADPAVQTQTLIKVLQSDASFFEKARACQQLGEMGTPDAVPVLASLLSDPKLGAYARSGLEGIPDPSAAAALRDAVPTLKGPQLAGVINSLGVLRDAQSVDLVAKLAADPSSGVATDALLALGNIATPESIRVLEEAMINGPTTSRAEAAAACLLAADRLRTTGDLNRAVLLFDLIRKASVPVASRVGATRGAILARGADRVPFLMTQLKSKEPAIRHAALLAVRDVPDDALADALNAEVTRAVSDLQQQLLLAIADCHNAQSIPVVQALGDNPNPQTRKTAFAVLGRLGPNAAPALLAALEKDRPPDEAAVVLNALRAMEGSAVDDLIGQALNSATATKLRINLIRLLERRSVGKANVEIMKLAITSDKDVRIAALTALKSLASGKELAALIQLTGTSADQETREAAEDAVAGVCSRVGDGASEAILNELKRATTLSDRNRWIRVLGRVGYANALPAIEAAASQSEAALADNALATLGQWPNPTPMPTLLTAMKSAPSPELQRRAFTSVINLATTAVDEGQAPAPTVVVWLELAAPVAQSAPDKLKIVSLLGRLKTVDSLRLLTPYLDDSSVRVEASVAVVQIAPALAKTGGAAPLKSALEKIIANPANGDLRDRAQQALKAVAAAAEEAWVTVRPQDTGEPLVNPGMGWTLHFYSNYIENYGSKLAPSDTLDDWPGLSVIYLRVPWSFLEPKEGEFNWALFDTPAQRWIDKGKKIAIRVSCSESWWRYATPKWVQDAGAKGIDFEFGKGPKEGGPLWDPDYLDPVFLEKLDHFIAALARRYDGNPNVAFIDIGSFGMWGEGHTGFSSRLNEEQTLAVVKKHVDLHLNHFKHTLLCISDDVAGASKPGRQFPAMDYALSKGVTMRDDSILVQAPPNSWYHSDMAQEFWPRLPVILEHEHYGSSKARQAWSGDLLLKSVEDYHASYMSIHWWPREELEENRETIRRINQRLGYRLQLREIRWPARASLGEPFFVETTWANAGVAPCYDGAFWALTLKDDKGGIVSVHVDESFDLKQLKVGAPEQAPVEKLRSRCTVAFRHVDQSKSHVPPVKPGSYDVFVSVGQRDGTPTMALPLPGPDGSRRYKVGQIVLK